MPLFAYCFNTISRRFKSVQVMRCHRQWWTTLENSKEYAHSGLKGYFHFINKSLCWRPSDEGKAKKPSRWNSSATVEQIGYFVSTFERFERETNSTFTHTCSLQTYKKIEWKILEAPTRSLVHLTFFRYFVHFQKFRCEWYTKKRTLSQPNPVWTNKTTQLNCVCCL